MPQRPEDGHAMEPSYRRRVERSGARNFRGGPVTVVSPATEPLIRVRVYRPEDGGQEKRARIRLNVGWRGRKSALLAANDPKAAASGKLPCATYFGGRSRSLVARHGSTSEVQKRTRRCPSAQRAAENSAWSPVGCRGGGA